MKNISANRLKVAIDINQDILPSFGLGGLLIGMHVEDIQHLFEWDLKVRGGGNFLLQNLTVRYFLAKRTIGVDVDVRNGIIFRISALEGYKGLLMDKVSVEMNTGKAISLMPSLKYYEAENILTSKAVSGFCIELADDYSPEEVERFPIHAISVFQGDNAIQAEIDGATRLRRITSSALEKWLT